MGGGGQHEGFDALDYRKIKHGDTSKLGKYGASVDNELKELCDARAALRIAHSDFETLKYILSLITTVGQRGAWAVKRTLHSS